VITINTNKYVNEHVNYETGIHESKTERNPPSSHGVVNGSQIKGPSQVKLPFPFTSSQVKYYAASRDMLLAAQYYNGRLAEN